MTNCRRCVTLACLVLLAAPDGRGQSPSNQRMFIPLPTAVQPYPPGHPITESPDKRNHLASDIVRIDLPIALGGGVQAVRFYYTTDGRFTYKSGINEDGPNLPEAEWKLFPGRLRPVDIAAPFPTISEFIGNNGVEWPKSLGGSNNWDVLAPVANWNQTLGGDDATTLLYAKGNSLVGLLSYRGMLFVDGPHRNDRALDPFGNKVIVRWNGLSILDGTLPPSGSFDPANGLGKELWSTGPNSDGTTNLQRATPEGNDHVFTRPANGAGHFLLVANYCGEERAGYLQVQDITNLMSVSLADRYLVPLYELLADWVETVPPPGTSAEWADQPFGPEVPRSFFTAPYGQDVSGNKFRPVTVVDVPSGVPYNGGKVLVFSGLNLDPVDFDSYDEAPAYRALDDSGRDDGKYDYVAISDVTKMRRNLLLPDPQDGSWYFKDPVAWAEHTTFLRLPPDVPSGWNWTAGLPVAPGFDWSQVAVQNPVTPAPPGQVEVAFVTLVGSATVKSIASHPDGTHVYVVTSDQGEDEIIENPAFIDGGWQVPHVYVLDLAAGDFTSQPFLNGFTSEVRRYRFNKHVRYLFDGSVSPKVVGTTNVNATIRDMPVSSALATGPTLLTDPAANVGTAYPGEYQTDPTARTRLIAVRNDALATHRKRLYVGTKGRSQVLLDLDTSDVWRQVGAVHVLSLDADPLEPRWIETITLPMNAVSDPYQVAGLEVFRAATVPGETETARNVFVVTALSTLSLATAKDRLVVGQDR